MKESILSRLRNKYRTGGKLQDPYLTIGGRSINTDNGTRYGAGAKLSAPILESIRRGSDASGLRFETDFAGTNSGPVSISNDERGKAYNASIGLRGYHNKYINRNNTLSLNSNIGAGIGTGDENGDGQMNPFVDANLSLLKSGRTRKGTNVSGGPTLSYGTEGSPNQGLRLGLEGNYGRLSGNVEYDITNKSPRIGASLNFQEGGMYNHMKQYQMGGQQLPGGEMEPIPGSDAVQFNGQSHDQGGIMLDGQTEVEGGETMDQVTMAKNGGKRSDYFFSDHLKKGGVSYANMHKEILAEGGDQQEINMLAQMQEKAAGRDPNQVAKLGGVVKYENGGPQSPNSNQRTQNVQAAADPDYIAQMNELLGLSGNNLIEDDGMSTEDREARRNARRPQVADQNKRKLKNLQLFVDQGRELTAEQQLEYDTLYQSSTNYGAPVTANQTPTYSDAELSADMEEADDPDAYSAEQGQTALATITQREYEKSPEGIQAAKDAKKAARKLARTLNPGMPTEAKIGAGAQFLPAVTAMLTKQKSAEEYKYENGFEAPIVAGRVKGQTYDAPTQNEARARLASSYTGEQKFLDTSGAGGAGLSNRQALFAKKLQAEGTLGAQESRDAITAENLTKKSAEQANIRNVQNELTASTTNAQMIQKEADRKTAVDNANVQLRNMQEQEKISNRMNIVNNLSQGVAGVMGDTMAYKSQERMAKAVGGDGIYQRDILSNYLAKQPGNENKSKEEINQMVLKIYNA